MNMKGQTIVEVVVALGVAAAILTAMTMVITVSLSSIRNTSSSNTATQYARDALELLRTVQNSDYAAFSGYSGSYCMASTCSSLSNDVGTSCGKKSGACNKNINDLYVREVTVTQNDASCRPANPLTGTVYAKVSAKVSWTDSKCTDSANRYCHSSQLESCMTNLNSRKSP